MLTKRNWFLYITFQIGALLFAASGVLAQDNPAAEPAAGTASAKQFPSAKQKATPVTTESGEETSAARKKEESKDGPDELRKRAEWFYKQRASANGHIPAGARGNAFRHMQNMMVAEGKLTRRADGTFAEAAASSAAASAFPAWTPLGPAPTTGGEFSPVSGRVTTIAVDPTDAKGDTVLIGGAQGGIWRSTDAGITWTAVGDQNASLSMGSMAFAPSSPSTVYAGTGEQEGIGFDIYYGAGVLKSVDSGKTWTQPCTVPSLTCPFIGPYNDVTPFGYFTLGGTRISYVAVNPNNPQMVLVGAETQFAEGPTEGVYCSDDSGVTWTNILPDEMATFVGFASSTIAYAALGNPYGSSNGAPHGNGIYKAVSIGTKCGSIQFAQLTSGTLPIQSSMGRIDLGIAPSDSTGKTLYASIADSSMASSTNLGVFFTSDGGNTWTQTGAPDICQQQCWYDNVVKVDPLHAGTIFLGGSSVSDANGNPEWVMRSINSGTNWASVIPNSPGIPGLPHVDNHAMAFVKLPSGKVRMYLGNDGGVWRTDDAEAATIAWTNLNGGSLTLTQFYPAISIPASTPSFSIAGTQDNGTQEYSGTSNWTDTGECGDGTGTVIDPLIPSSVYIACNGDFLLASYQNGAAGTFSPAVNGINQGDFLNFVPPFVADPNTGNTLYLGTTKIYQSTDGANSWTPISYDLVNGSNFDSLTAIAVAPGAPQNVYAGASNGGIFVANNVSQGALVNFYSINNSGLLPRRAVTAIAVDPADISGKTAYVGYSGFSYVSSTLGVNDSSGHIFKTSDGGITWADVSCSVVAPSNCAKPAASDLPNIPVNDIVADPDLLGTLYAATDLGVFVGTCSPTSCTWTTLSSGLPRVAVLSLKLHEPSRTLRAATHGRGAWDLHLNNFSFNGPHISSITPISANSGGTQLTLTVNGSGLTGGVIQFGGTALTATGTSSDTALSGTVPVALLATGTVQIMVKVGSASSNPLPFAVLGGAPTITSVTPASTPVQANPSNNVTIQLAGTNFTNGTKVLFNEAPNGITVAAASSACPLPTCLKAILPAALLGPYGSTNDIAVVVSPPGGGTSAAKIFKVVAPVPPNDNIANATNITLLYTVLYQDTSSATTESTDPVAPCVNQYPTANANTGGHPNGDYNTIWYTFTPQFSADLYLDMSSSNYDTVLSIWAGAPGSLANVACNDDITSGVVIQSRLPSVALTGGTTYYIMVGSFGPPDPNPVALGGSSILQFMYNGGVTPVPTLTSISPNTANSGDPGVTININGSGFLNGAVAYLQNPAFGNLTPENTTFVSSTKLTATIAAADITLPGTYQVVVQNAQPSYGYSNQETFTVNVGTYPVPTLNSIYPTSVVAGSLPFVLSASGNNFASTAVIKFNGVAKQTTYGSPVGLSAAVSAADVATPGTVQVTVSNPTPGGGTSAPQALTIAAPTAVPTIATISPNTAVANSYQTLTITGTNFINGASVYFAGYYSYATVASSTQLTVQISMPMTPATYQVYVVDPLPAGTSAPFNFIVTGPPDFSVASSGVTSLTVPAGTTANFTNAISILALNSFSSPVALSCSLPAKAVTCSVTPNNFPTGAGTASVQVTTQARGMLPPAAPFVFFWLSPGVVVALALMMQLFIWRFARTRRQRLALSFPLASVLLLLVMQLMGCGGGGYTQPPPPPPPTGTAAGIYTITVTATATTTSGTLTHTGTLTLTVQ